MVQRKMWYLVRDVNRFYGNMCKRYARCFPKWIAVDSVLAKINGKSVKIVIMEGVGANITVAVNFSSVKNSDGNKTI